MRKKDLLRIIYESKNDFINLTYEDFDYSKNSPWRKLDNNGDHKGAIRILKIYLKHNKDKLEYYQIGAILWHIGQIYGYLDDYKNAIKYISSKYTKLSIPLNYRNATIAFFKGDLDTIKKLYRKSLKDKSEDPMNLRLIKNFINYFGEKYSTAYEK
jgi:tetratricopeptide (TPR) repeat protein